jgi:hypothetical protein
MRQATGPKHSLKPTQYDQSDAANVNVELARQQFTAAKTVGIRLR